MDNLCAGICSSLLVEKGAGDRWLCQRRGGLQDPVRGWQLSPGISGNFRVESAAALPWNRWQDSSGIGGSFGVEYALWPHEHSGFSLDVFKGSRVAYNLIKPTPDTATRGPKAHNKPHS